MRKALKHMVDSAFAPAVTEALEVIHQQGLVIESGVLGGDLIPRSHIEPTIKALENELDKIAIETEDNVSIMVVGSGRFGMETKSTFGDIDVIMRMKKPETLSRIKQWVAETEDIKNIRDIQSRKSGDYLDPDNLGDQFSFLYSIQDENGKKVSVEEIRSALSTLRGQPNMTYRANHDQRLRIDSNLKNLEDKEDQPAMVQVDVMKVIVDGMEFGGLIERAQKLAARLDEISFTEESGNEIDANQDGKITRDEITRWIKQFLDGDEVEDFDSHYDFLKNHGELQSNEDQKLLAAIHLLSDEENFNGKIDGKFSNIGFRYSFHPDSLQLINFLAGKLGMQLDDDNFTPETLQSMIDIAKPRQEPVTGMQKTSPNTRVDAGKDEIGNAGLVSDKLTVDIMRNPSEFFRMLKGKLKKDAQAFVIRNTKNKRADEANPHALYKNYGTRRVRQV